MTKGIINTLRVGDDIDVSGVVSCIENGCIQVKTKTGTKFWIEPEDTKTFRPKLSIDISLDNI